MRFFSHKQPITVQRPRAGPVDQHRPRHVLGLEESVSLAGSIWTRGVVDDLALSQSDYFVEGVSNSLTLQSLAAAVVGRVAFASSALSLLQTNTVAGGRVDTGGGGGGVETVPAIFDSTTPEGGVVYIPSNGHADLAQANQFATSIPVGLATGAVTAGNTGEFLTGGPITLADWSLVIGTQFLTPGAIYYLDPANPGRMTTVCPETSGHYVIIVGTAANNTTFDINIHRAYRNG